MTLQDAASNAQTVFALPTFPGYDQRPTGVVADATETAPTLWRKMPVEIHSILEVNKVSSHITLQFHRPQDKMNLERNHASVFWCKNLSQSVFVALAIQRSGLHSRDLCDKVN